MEKATLGAGCFWCAEAAFKLLPGVLSATPGYAEGIETVQIEYNPEKTSYQDLLNIFWEIHDPTQKDRQGPDVGKEYQAVIFYHTTEQQTLAEESREAVAKKYENPVMTEIRAFKNFFPAEEHHKDFYARNPDLGYSKAVIAPKVAKVKKLLHRA